MRCNEGECYQSPNINELKAQIAALQKQITSLEANNTAICPFAVDGVALCISETVDNIDMVREMIKLIKTRNMDAKRERDSQLGHQT